jgi:adenylate kinase
MDPYTGDACAQGGKCDIIQRTDDKAEVVADRLRVYREQTAPLVAYYQAQNKLTRIDGSKNQSEVESALGRVVS